MSRPLSNDRLLTLVIAGLLACYLAATAFHVPLRTGKSISGGLSQFSSDENGAVPLHPPYWMVTPFVVLLAAIAVLPLLRGAALWWESNLHRFYVAGGLAAFTLACYYDQVGPVLAKAMLHEYVPFIVLLFSLYTISGGIRIEGDLPAHPLVNCAFLAAGACWRVSSARPGRPCC